MHDISAECNRKAASIVAILMLLAAVVRFPVPHAEVRLMFAAVAELAVAGIVAVVLWRINPWISAFICLATVSTWVPEYSRHTFFAFHAVFYGALIYGAVWFFREHINVFMDAMIVICLANVVFLIMQTCGYDPMYSPVYTKSATVPVGLMGNRNITSGLIAFTLPAFLRRNRAWMIPAPIAGLLMAKTFGGPMAVYFGSVFFAHVYFGKARLVILAGILALALFYLFFDKPTLYRILAWTKGVQIWSDRPIFGWGIGHWKTVFQHVYVREGMWYSTAHNEFIQGLFEMGIAFPVIVAGYIISAIREYRPKAATGAMGLIIVFGNSLVSFPFHVATTAMVAVVWMGIYDAQTV